MDLDYTMMNSWLRMVLPTFLLISILVAESGSFNSVQAQESPRHVFERAWEIVKLNYYDSTFNGKNWEKLKLAHGAKISTTDDAQKAIQELLSELDNPSTKFFDNKTFGNRPSAAAQKIVGIGINVQQTKDGSKKLLVTRTIDQGPAEIAGVKAGDEIRQIDGRETKGKTPEDAAKLIRGRVGNPVKFVMRRDGKDLKFTVVRAEIVIRSVSVKQLQHGIGYIQIATLYGDAAREFKSALRKFATASGLIIDLRGNKGGITANALEISDILLASGEILVSLKRSGRHTDISSGTPLSNQPVVVLVDSETGAEAETIVAALKDNKRAKVVGDKTSGNGFTHQDFELPDHSGISVAVAKHLSPNGTDYCGSGIKPDMMVTDDADRMPIAMNVLKDEIAAKK